MKRSDKSKLSSHSATLRSYTVKSVLRAATILKTFRSMEEILELRTVAKRSSFNKGTTFRLSETLVEAGLLERVGRQGYRLRVDLNVSKRYRLGYAAQNAQLPYTAIVTNSLIAAASAANIELVVLNNRFSPKAALLNASRFVKAKVDLVVDSQLDYSIAGQLAAIFSDAHIPVVALDNPLPGAFYFGVDNYRAGRIAGRYLGRWAVKHWGGEVRNIVLIGAEAGGSVLRTRLTGIYDGIIEAAPHLRNVQPTYLDSKAQFDRTLEVMRKYVRNQRPRRVLVGGVNDVSALAALQAFREYGAEGECAVCGQDACSEARNELRRKCTQFVCSVAYFPETYGDKLMKLAVDILNQKPVPPAIFTQHELVTAANVDKVYPNDSWINGVDSVPA